MLSLSEFLILWYANSSDFHLHLLLKHQSYLESNLTGGKFYWTQGKMNLDKMFTFIQ